MWTGVAFWLPHGLSSATAVAMAAGPAHAARTARTKTSPSLRIGAGFLSVGINGSGYVDSLVDLRDGTDHLAKDTPVPLVSVVADGKHVVPAKARVVSSDRAHHRQVLEFMRRERDDPGGGRRVSHAFHT